jgi:SPX domain protein involved in polyphosphate accumulation
MGNNYYKRFEQKYQLSDGQYELLKPVLNRVAKPDQYGTSCIRSLYMDTPDYDLIERCIHAKGYKEKLRVRSYGTADSTGISSDDTVYIELKKKLKGITYKRRMPLSYAALYGYMEGQYSEEPSRAANEIEWFLRTWKPRGRFVISYTRLSMEGREDPDLRITLDKNVIAQSMDNKDDMPALIDSDEYILEIKSISSIPYELSHALSELKVFPVSFSKTKTAYSLFNSIINEVNANVVNANETDDMNGEMKYAA